MSSHERGFHNLSDEQIDSINLKPRALMPPIWLRKLWVRIYMGLRFWKLFCPACGRWMPKPLWTGHSMRCEEWFE